VRNGTPNMYDETQLLIRLGAARQSTFSHKEAFAERA
jgi:hypothetical protein